MRRTRAIPSAVDIDYARSKLYQAVFGTDAGQKVLKDICERLCGTSLTPMKDKDPFGTAYLIGRQDIARELMRLCNPQLDSKKPNVITDTPHDSGI